VATRWGGLSDRPPRWFLDPGDRLPLRRVSSTHGKDGLVSSHQHSVVVDRPVRTVYDQWTQFEKYPDFMENVEMVRQLGETMTHWKVRVGGVEREYDAAITEQRPDELISWHSVAGPEQGGMVTFDPLEPDRTRVTLRLDFEPDGFTESVGDAVGVVSSSVEHSLERFKEFIEDRGTSTGSWRGTVADGGVTATGTGALGGDPAAGGSAAWSDGPSTTSEQRDLGGLDS
jgi:uncharacterized membrane protein